MSFARDGEAGGPVHATELPAGRYVTYTHAGAYQGTSERWAGRDLPAAYDHVEAWAREREIAWQTVQTEAGTGLRARVERYLVGPPLEDDVEKWQTELSFLVKDGATS